MTPMGGAMGVVSPMGAHRGRLHQVGIALSRAMARAIISSHHNLTMVINIDHVCDCGHVAVHDVRVVHGEHLFTRCATHRGRRLGTIRKKNKNSNYCISGYEEKNGHLYF